MCYTYIFLWFALKLIQKQTQLSLRGERIWVGPRLFTTIILMTLQTKNLKYEIPIKQEN